jgi:hypothetical protein
MLAFHLSVNLTNSERTTQFVVSDKRKVWWRKEKSKTKNGNHACKSFIICKIEIRAKTNPRPVRGEDE